MKNTTINKNLSHNVYSDDLSSEKFKLPTYLILFKNIINGKNCNEICTANNVSDAIEISLTKSNSAIYRLNGSVGKSYSHYFNANKGE